jgi:hypothetical protein
MTDRAKVHKFRLGWAKVFHLLNARRQEMVIQNGLNGGKSFKAHEFFAIQFAILFFELGMALVRDFSELVIEGHGFSLMGNQ